MDSNADLWALMGKNCQKIVGVFENVHNFHKNCASNAYMLATFTMPDKLSKFLQKKVNPGYVFQQATVIFSLMNSNKAAVLIQVKNS